MDVWGISDKLEAYLRIKQAARDRADPSSSVWGVFGGGTGAGKKRKAAGSSFNDERRREEADRFRAQLERVAKPVFWKKVRLVNRPSIAVSLRYRLAAAGSSCWCLW